MTTTLFDMPTNPSVADEDKPRLSQQALIIYLRLRQGPLLTHELSAIAPQYNARLYEIRRWLRDERGWWVHKTKVSKGTYSYAIGPFIEGVDYVY